MIPRLEKLCAHNIFVMLYKKFRYDNYYEEIPYALDRLNLNLLCKRKILRRLNKVKFKSRNEFLDYLISTPSCKIDFYLITYYIVIFDCIDIYLEHIEKDWDYKLLSKFFSKPLLRKSKYVLNIHGNLKKIYFNDNRLKEHTQIKIVQRFKNMHWDYKEISKCAYHIDITKFISDFPDKDWDFKELSKHFNKQLNKFLENNLDKDWDFYELTNKLEAYNALKYFIKSPNKNWNFQILSKYYYNIPKLYYEDNNYIDYHLYDSDSSDEPDSSYVSYRGISFNVFDMFKFNVGFLKKINEEWNYNLLLEIIPYEFIANNKNYPWNLKLMVKNTKFTIYDIEKIFEKIDFKEISKYIPFSKLEYTINHYDWDFNVLSKRCLTSTWFKFVLSYKNKSWNLNILNNNLIKILENTDHNLEIIRILHDKKIWNIINVFRCYLWDKKIINYAKSLGLKYNSLNLNNLIII
jgi:hypothetical protein